MTSKSNKMNSFSGIGILNSLTKQSILEDAGATRKDGFQISLLLIQNNTFQPKIEQIIQKNQILKFSVKF